MKEKGNKNLIVAIVLLGVGLFLSVGYIIYDSYFGSSKVEDKEQSKIDDSIISDVKDFPTTNDADVKEYYVSDGVTEAELKTNFKNIVKIKDNLKFEYSCNYYYEEEKYCDEILVKLTVTNNGLEAVIDLGNNNFNYQSDDLYVTNQYIIKLSGGGGVDNIGFYIYDFSGNLKYTNENAISYYEISEQDSTGFSVRPKISNNILYFVTVEKDSQDGLEFNYIDLNAETLKDVLIQKFKAFFYYENY